MAIKAFKNGVTVFDEDVMNRMIRVPEEAVLYEGSQVDAKTGAGVTENSLADYNYAIRFTATGTTEVARIELNLDRDNLGADLTIEIRSGLLADGSNDGTLLATIVVPKEHIPDPAAYWKIPVNLRGLTPGNQYWIVVKRAGDAVNKVDLMGEASADGSYPVYRRAASSGAWTTGRPAIHFRVYSGRTGEMVHTLYDGGGHETYDWTVAGVFLRTYYWLPPSDDTLIGGIRDIENIIFDGEYYDRTEVS